MLLVEGLLSRRLLYMKELVIHIVVPMDRLRHCAILCVSHGCGITSSKSLQIETHHSRGGCRQLPRGISHYAHPCLYPKLQPEFLMWTSLLFKMTIRAILRKSCEVLNDQNDLSMDNICIVYCAVIGCLGIATQSRIPKPPLYSLSPKKWHFKQYFTVSECFS